MPALLMSLLFVVCMTLATYLHLWFLGWEGNRASSANVLTVLMGDSRRMFANHFFVKADVYFHRGYYPSIFDHAEAHEENHLAATAADSGGKGGADHDRDGDEHEHDFLGQPKDWIERLNRHLTPSVHTELIDQGGGMVREILPWLWLSAELDPQRVETYTVASFWLSEHIGNVGEAEKFLRQGLRENPNSYEILYELGRLHDVHHHDLARARNLWEISLRRWRQQEGVKDKPDYFVFERLASRLANLEERQGNLVAAIGYLEMVRPVSPHPGRVQEQIDELKGKLNKAGAASLPRSSAR